MSLWLRRVRDALDEPHDEDLGELGMTLHQIGRRLIFCSADGAACSTSTAFTLRVKRAAPNAAPRT